MSRLLSISELIHESWSAYAKYWHKSLHISAWFLLLPAISFLAVVATRASADTSEVLFGVLSIIRFIMVIWVTVRLYRWLLTEEKHIPEPEHEGRTAWSLVLPLLWTSLLKGLAIAGGFMLFVFPGIWIAVLLQFSELFLLGDGYRGTQAIAASYALVKGRWWEVFWRLVVPGALFLTLSIVLIGAISTILGFIAGAGKIDTILSVTGSNPLIDSSRQLIEGLTQMIFLPLFLVWQIKLFRSLKESQA